MKECHDGRDDHLRIQDVKKSAAVGGNRTAVGGRSSEDNQFGGCSKRNAAVHDPVMTSQQSVGQPNGRGDDNSDGDDDEA